jgi:hypothetical protein
VKDSLVLGLAQTVYKAAGHPQGIYTCLLSMTVRTGCEGVCRQQVLPSCQLEMRALIPIALKRMRGRAGSISVDDRLVRADSVK